MTNVQMTNNVDKVKTYDGFTTIAIPFWQCDPAVWEQKIHMGLVSLTLTMKTSSEEGKPLLMAPVPASA